MNQPLVAALEPACEAAAPAALGSLDSDAPELVSLNGDVAPEGGLIALDDQGAIVSYAESASDTAVADGWSESSLAALLADCDAAEDCLRRGASREA